VQQVKPDLVVTSQNYADCFVGENYFFFEDYDNLLQEKEFCNLWGDGAIICVENDKGAKDTMEDNVKQFGVHNVQIIPDLSEESMAKIPTPRLSFIVANKHLEEDIQRLLKKNPKMQFVIYTLELNILSGIKPLFDKYGISNMEVLQINVAKTNKDSMFVNQPAPWLITGEVL
jgi:precorrin-6Y C5,15-methyltransferase (decarboxylating)